MFAGPNSLWISADRSTRFTYDPATALLSAYVNDVEALRVSTTYQSVRRVIVADGTSVTLTAADSGALCIFDKTDGALFTLPTAEAGLRFEFITSIVTSSGSHKVITASASQFIKGMLLSVDTDTSLALAINQAGDGSTHRAITQNGTTTGGIAHSRYSLTAISSTLWMVEGINLGSGIVATPFATS